MPIRIVDRDNERRELGEHYHSGKPEFLVLYGCRRVENTPYWSAFTDDGSHQVWARYAFEQVALAHIDQIKFKLQIGGVLLRVYSWQSVASQPNVQIDLIIAKTRGSTSARDRHKSGVTYHFSYYLWFGS